MSKASNFYPTETTVTAGEAVYEYTDTMNNLYFEPNMDFDNSICFAKSDKPIVAVTHAVGTSAKGWEWESFKFNTGDTAFFKPSVDMSDGESNLLVAMAECGRGVQGYDHSLQWGVSHNSDSAKYVNANYMRFLKNGELSDMVSWIQFNGYKISEDMKPVTVAINDLYENASDYLVENIKNYTTSCKDATGTSFTNKFFPVFIMDNNLYTGVFTLRHIFNTHSTPTINCKNKSMSGGSSAFLYQGLDTNYVREFNNPPIKGDGINTGWNRDNPPSDEYITVGEDFRTIIQAKWGATFAADGTVNGLTLNSFRRLVKGEYALQMLAYTGVFYTDDQLNGKPWDGFGSHIYCGYMSSNGITTGEMLRGEDIEKSDTAQKKYKIDNDVFDPNWKPPSDDNDDIDDMKLGFDSQVNGFASYYQCTAGNLQNLSEQMTAQTEYTDLLRNVVSLKSYAINTSNFITASEMANIKIGAFTSTVEAVKINAYKYDLKIGSYSIDGEYGSSGSPHYLDFNPYTKMEVYIPYCGVIEIPDKCMYKTIDVYIVGDIISGCCVGVIKCEGNIVAQKSGIIGNDIPLSMTDNAVKTNSFVSGALNAAGIAAQAVVGASSMNAQVSANAFSSAVQNANQMRMAMNANYTRVVGVTSDKLEYALPNTCYIKIYSPIVDQPADYAHRFGKPCNKSCKLSDLSGFTQCYNPTINGNMTLSEKNKIIQLLSEGIYI